MNLLPVECFFGVAAATIALSFIYGGVYALRCLVVQVACDILQICHSAKQLGIDHERAKSDLDFEQSKNELEIEAARQKLLINRQKVLSIGDRK